MTWGAYIVGMVSSLFGYLYLKCEHSGLDCYMLCEIDCVDAADTGPEYNGHGQYTAPVILLAFLIGIQCCMYTSRRLTVL